jgi:hypothetical protein
VKHPERVEQAHGVKLLRSLGAQVWVLGTTRPKGDFHGTCQTPGISDCVVALPRGLGMLFWEVKSAKGRLRPEQEQFRLACMACEAPNQVHYVTGDANALIEWLMMLGLLKKDAVAWYRMPKELTITVNVETNPDRERLAKIDAEMGRAEKR